MASISALGVGSGVLTSDLVDQLVAAERRPAEVRLDQRTERTEALISAYSLLRSAVTELRLPMRQLSAPDAMRAFTATSSSANVNVSVDGSKANRGSYNVNVLNLAQAQALASQNFADRDATSIGQGKLTLSVGDRTTEITIDSGNDTLQGIARAINDANAGVSAGIIDTGDGYQLVLSADETGTANAISINVEESAGAAGLSRLAFNDDLPEGEGLRQTIEAKDAVMELNGVEVRRATNTIEGLIDGLTFTLVEEGQSTVKVEQDTSGPADRVQEFVSQFNELQRTISDLTKFDSERGQASILTGDATVRNVQSQLRQVLLDVVPGLEGANVRSLADVGITTDAQTGELQFDRQRFERQLRENPSDVTALFSEQGRATDSQVEFVRSGTGTQPGNYDINVTQMATRGAVGFDLSGAGNALTVGANNSLSFRVDGETSVKVSLEAGTYTQEELVQALQKELNANTALRSAGRSVQVGLSEAGELTFTSGKFGSESSVSITAASGVQGLSTRTGTAGLDVQGTINGQTARGDGQVLFLPGSTPGPAAGLQVRITGGDVGPRGSISFIEGVAQKAVNSITDLLGENGALSTRTSSLNRELERIQEERVKLDIRIESYQARLVRQFSAADSLIAQLNSTRDYVSQQLEALAPQNNRQR